MSDESTDADVILPGAEFRRMINELEQLRFVTDDLNRQVSSSLDQRDAALAEVQRLDAEVERCHERLEMTHRWHISPDSGEEARVFIPRAERSFQCDGIDCRDETIKGLDDIRDELEAALSASQAEVQRLREALTPSAETKAAYSGEFSIYLEEVDEHGDEQAREVPVPWTTIKAIMAAIRARSLVEPAP